MSDFLKIKNQSYFNEEMNEFLNKATELGLDKNKKVKLEKALWEFLIRVKESIYRKVEQEYHTNDLMDKIKERYGMKGLRLAKALPDAVLIGIIDDWQDDLGNSDTFCEINWEVLENILAEIVWLSGLRKFKPNEITLYKCYLQDWFKNHNEGSPVCIREFFDCEMKDEKLKNYYLSLARKRRRKSNG